MQVSVRSTASLSAYLGASVATLARLVPRFSRRVDVEPVHAARVATRRTQAVLWIARTADARLTFPELDADLRSLAQALGARRDLDVALETDPALALLQQRRTVTAALAALAAPAAWTPVAEALHAAVQALTDAAPTLDLAPAQKRLRKRLGRWLDEPPDDAVASEAVHDLRKCLKRTRYALEALELNAAPLHAAQQELGRMHDVEVLMALRGETKDLRKTAAKHRKKGLKKAEKALVHARRALRRTAGAAPIAAAGCVEAVAAPALMPAQSAQVASEGPRYPNTSRHASPVP